MKNRLIVILLCTLILACHSPVKQSLKKNKKLTTIKTDIEYLDWNNVRLNGNINMISSFKKVVSKIGAPDSIGKLSDGVNGSFYAKKFQYCYFKGVTFEKYHDTLVFSEIDFSKRNNFYLTDDKKRFNNLTTGEDFKRIFPYSFENNQLSGTDMDKYQMITLKTSDNNSDGEWDFIFDVKTKKILSIQYYDRVALNN